MPTLINTRNELKDIQSMVAQLWDNPTSMDAAIEQAFNAGIEQGKPWIKYSAKHLSIRSRAAENMPAWTGVYDGFYQAYSFVLHEISQIENIVTHHSVWNFSDAAKSVTAQVMKSNPDFSPTAKDISSAKQIEITSSFDGDRFDTIREILINEALRPNHVNFRHDEHGYSIEYLLISAVFSHGLLCAETNNSNEFSQSINSVFDEYSSKPFNSENLEEIKEKLTGIKFFDIAIAMSPESFGNKNNHQEYLSAIKAANERKQETKKDEGSKRESFKDTLSDIMAEIDDEENNLPKIQNRHKMILAMV